MYFLNFLKLYYLFECFFFFHGVWVVKKTHQIGRKCLETIFKAIINFFYVKRNSIALLSCRSVAPGLKIFGWTTVKKNVSNLQLSFPFQGDFDENSVNWAGPSSPCKGYFLYKNLKVRWKCWS